MTDPSYRISDDEMDEVTKALEEEDVEGQRLRNAGCSAVDNVRRPLKTSL